MIKDQQGVEQEYEVLEESEEEENSVSNLNFSVLKGEKEQNFKIKNNGVRDGEQISTRRRVMIDGEGMDDESFYIEEIIEESEEESDEMDNYGGHRQSLSNV